MVNLWCNHIRWLNIHERIVYIANWIILRKELIVIIMIKNFQILRLNYFILILYLSYIGSTDRTCSFSLQLKIKYSWPFRKAPIAKVMRTLDCSTLNRLYYYIDVSYHTNSACFSLVDWFFRLFSFFFCHLS